MTSKYKLDRINLGINFSRDGRRAAILQQIVYKKNKPYGLTTSTIPLYMQSLYVIDLSRATAVAIKIFKEETLLQQYYRDQRVKWVNFSDENPDAIWLVFDDEILFLSTNCGKLTQTFRIQLDSLSQQQSVFQGFWKDSYIFSQPPSSSVDELRLVDVEYVKKGSLCEVLGEGEEKSEIFGRNKQLENLDADKNDDSKDRLIRSQTETIEWLQESKQKRSFSHL